MNAIKAQHKQRGFFDFGISLGLLFLFGSTAVFIDVKHAEKEAYANQTVQTSVDKMAIAQSSQDQ